MHLFGRGEALRVGLFMRRMCLRGGNTGTLVYAVNVSEGTLVGWLLVGV